MTSPIGRRSIVAHVLLAAVTLAAAAALVTALAPRAFGADDPVVAFSASATTGVAPFTVTFSGTSTGVPIAWDWDLGDGTKGTTAVVDHPYASPGTFTVRLTVTYADHAPIVVTKKDYVVATPPPLAAVLVVTGVAHFTGLPVAFEDASTGHPTGRTWDFGDGGSSTLEKPSHTYAAKGSYTVTLTARKGAGTDVATTAVTILDPWAGTVQLYQPGIYSSQATMRWCVAASTQIIRNIVRTEQDHKTRTQQSYNAYGRHHNGYKTPASDGIDPAGWQAMLRAFVTPSYHIVSSSSYTAAIRAAAKALRLTGRPVGVFVGHGSHVWVLSGFTATADPATTNVFTVTSINVEGPLWGRRPTINGFDQVPNVKLSAAGFRRFLTPYRDPHEPHGWRNRYVIVAP